MTLQEARLNKTEEVPSSCRTRRNELSRILQGCIWCAFVLVVLCGGCRTPQEHRTDADKAAYAIIKEGQQAAGREEPFTIERPSQTLRRMLLKEQNLAVTGPASFGSDELDPIDHWPEPKAVSADGPGSAAGGILPMPGQAVKLTLTEALEIGAANSFEYQKQKEEVFAAALELDKVRHDFANQFESQLSAMASADRSSGSTVSGTEYGATTGWSRRLENGAQLSANFAAGLASILTADRVSSLGLQADASVQIPLLRGAGSHIAREPLTQAERNVLYAVWNFERFKQRFAVEVASAYLGVLRQMNQVRNAEENYKGLITSARRIKRLAEAGRLQQIEVDQAGQDELTARNRWVTAQQDYLARFDELKILLGLPTDANIVLDKGELSRLDEELVKSLAEEQTGTDANSPVPPADAPVVLREAGLAGAGRLEMRQEEAVRVALARRADLLVAQGQVYDAQRQVVVAADQLRPEFTLLGTTRLGESRDISKAGSSDAQLRFDRARYQALLTLDLPLDRQIERDNYRISLVNFEQAVRAQQALEDTIKQNVRDDLRNLMEARESVQIQAKAVKLAEKRVRSTGLFLQAGRAQVRDVLDAQEALLSAQNALTAAVVGYRVAELSLQRDMGVLMVNEKGLWQEYRPGDNDVAEE
jgi:outer membrane protein TolC